MTERIILEKDLLPKLNPDEQLGYNLRTRLTIDRLREDMRKRKFLKRRYLTPHLRIAMALIRNQIIQERLEEELEGR